MLKVNELDRSYPDRISIHLEGNPLTLVKLRENYACKLSKLPKGVFRCILEYYEPPMIKRVEHYNDFNPRYPINYTWPEEVSYQNPIIRVKREIGSSRWWF